MAKVQYGVKETFSKPMDEVKNPVKRTRKVVLSDDSTANVKMFACARLNKAATSIKVFGQCFGTKYNWSPEQIDKAESVLMQQVEQAVNNIRTGKKIAEAGISL
jgi:hypothetical protein